MTSPRAHVPIKDNSFYIKYYQKMMIGLFAVIILSMILVIALLYQVNHRPLPTFAAVSPNGRIMTLTPEDAPNLQPPILIKWASKAAVTAYTFDFLNYDQELSLARSYFTEAGWKVYLSSINNVVDTVRQNKLFVNGVVVGTPVISNQGDLPGRGFVWRIQLPFLVTYQSEDNVSRQSYMVVLTVVKVPTWENPAGIGIDQFVMI